MLDSGGVPLPDSRPLGGTLPYFVPPNAHPTTSKQFTPAGAVGIAPFSVTNVLALCQRGHRQMKVFKECGVGLLFAAAG
jgi:hypothetical protein